MNQMGTRIARLIGEWERRMKKNASGGFAHAAESTQWRSIARPGETVDYPTLLV